MSSKAFVLLQTNPNCTPDVIHALRGVDGVLTFSFITGPFDVLVEMEEADLDTIMRIVENKIQVVPGVIHTTTCLSLSRHHGPGKSRQHKTYDSVLQEINHWLEAYRNRPAVEYLHRKYDKRFGQDVVAEFAEEQFGPLRGGDPLKAIPHTVKRLPDGAYEIATLESVPIADGGSDKPMRARLDADGRVFLNGESAAFSEELFHRDYPNITRLLQHPKYRIEHGGE